MIKARPVPVPSDTVLSPLYVGADLVDAFAIYLPAGASDDLEVLGPCSVRTTGGVDSRANLGARSAPLRRRGVRCSATFRCCRKERRSWW